MIASYSNNIRLANLFVCCTLDSQVSLPSKQNREKKNKLKIYPKTHENSMTASLGSKFTGSFKRECIPMLPSILEPSRPLRNLPPPKQITKNLTMIQTNRLSNSSSA